MELFLCDDCDALIISPFSNKFKKLSTLPCSKTISAPTMLWGGNSESMWNMMMGTNLVIKSLGCIQNE